MPAVGVDPIAAGRRMAIAIGARRHALFRRLATAGKGDPNDIAVAGMCATWATGGGALPQVSVEEVPGCDACFAVEEGSPWVWVGIGGMGGGEVVVE